MLPKTNAVHELGIVDIFSIRFYINIAINTSRISEEVLKFVTYSMSSDFTDAHGTDAEDLSRGSWP